MTIVNATVLACDHAACPERFVGPAPRWAALEVAESLGWLITPLVQDDEPVTLAWCPGHRPAEFQVDERGSVV